MSTQHGQRCRWEPCAVSCAVLMPFSSSVSCVKWRPHSRWGDSHCTQQAKHRQCVGHEYCCCSSCQSQLQGNALDLCVMPPSIGSWPEWHHKRRVTGWWVLAGGQCLCTNFYKCAEHRKQCTYREPWHLCTLLCLPHMRYCGTEGLGLLRGCMDLAARCPGCCDCQVTVTALLLAVVGKVWSCEGGWAVSA